MGSIPINFNDYPIWMYVVVVIVVFCVLKFIVKTSLKIAILCAVGLFVVQYLNKYGMSLRGFMG